MKIAVILLVLVWLLCGLGGAWMLDDLDSQHWKAIARGPLTLMRAVNESGPDIDTG